MANNDDPRFDSVLAVLAKSVASISDVTDEGIWAERARVVGDTVIFQFEDTFGKPFQARLKLIDISDVDSVFAAPASAD